MKIAIIGHSGAGKSTLAKYLSEQYDATLLHIDKVHWLPGWMERPRKEELDMMSAFLDANGDWIIDGNYADLFLERRLQEADQVIFMNFSRVICLFRTIKRYCQYQKTTRESMTEGCPEKIDFEFVRWILWDSRSRTHRERYRQVLEKYNGKAVVIKNQRQLTAFMGKNKR